MGILLYLGFCDNPKQHNTQDVFILLASDCIVQDTMFKDTYILIWSQTPDTLMKFYRDVLELELTEKVDILKKDESEADYGYEFKLTPNMYVWIGKHSQVKGKSKEPNRIMHNLYTDEVEKWYQKVKTAGCEVLCPPTKTPFYTKEKPWYVSTFLDPEGNAWQFMGTLKT